MPKPRILSGMRPTGAAPPRQLHGRARQLGRACRTAYECFFSHRRLALAHHRLRRPRRDPRERARGGDRLARGRARPRALDALHPEPGARARRAAPAALDDRAGAVARAGADLQGAAAEPRGEGPLDLRLPRLPAAADGRHRHLQGRRGAGGRGPGAARRAGARDRAPLQQPLRRGVPRAADPADRGEAHPRHRRAQDVEVVRQRDLPEGRRRRRCGRSCGRWSPTPRASAAPTPATPRSARCSTCTRPSRRRRRASGRPQGCRTAGIGCLDCKAKLAEHMLQRLAADPRPAPGARDASRHGVGHPAARARRRPARSPRPRWTTCGRP